MADLLEPSARNVQFGAKGPSRQTGKHHTYHGRSRWSSQRLCQEREQRFTGRDRARHAAASLPRSGGSVRLSLLRWRGAFKELADLNLRARPGGTDAIELTILNASKRGGPTKVRASGCGQSVVYICEVTHAVDFGCEPVADSN